MGAPAKAVTGNAGSVVRSTGRVFAQVAPSPKGAPPPSDDVAAMIRALNKDATDRALRASKGRTAAFSLGRGSEPYRAPGSKSSMGL